MNKPIKAASPAAWEPEHYLKFSDLRLRPALDLLAQIHVQAPETITDLGCGAGNVTPFLRQRWPDALVTALDSSPEMLTRARAEHPNLGVTWLEADVRSWAPAKPQGLIFSNAVLHWVDDHQALFPRLMGELVSGGVLAVQMPHQFAEPSHVLMREVARSGPWADTLTPLLRDAPLGDMGSYYDVLAPLSATVNIWESTYAQMLDGDDAVLDWIGSTALKPLMEALTEDERVVFRDALAAELQIAYPKRSDGKTLFAFRRLFIVAQKA
ncbi:methyltransferase domain-containing protein [Magnetovibrio blakemorei]|uniref:Trans-aconitate 2-methyltransferase n=1 Tax=Magnetovibrio blakemorei TaxID=28181 RepID=A0A1E5QBB9_9PROT|nr:methyltransferase domain-containing protein [Magnetovibrio blakemorei]OEJ69244.1 hypothetical protein BEN30_03945 [Magnetovibrio blakemorei]